MGVNFSNKGKKDDFGGNFYETVIHFLLSKNNVFVKLQETVADAEESKRKKNGYTLEQ